MASSHINVILCTSVPSTQNGGLLVKLAPKLFDFTMDTPMQHTQSCAKNAKNDLKPTHFLKHNFYFETEGALNKRSVDGFIHLPMHQGTL